MGNQKSLNFKGGDSPTKKKKEKKALTAVWYSAQGQSAETCLKWEHKARRSKNTEKKTAGFERKRSGRRNAGGLQRQAAVPRRISVRNVSTGGGLRGTWKVSPRTEKGQYPGQLEVLASFVGTKESLSLNKTTKREEERTLGGKKNQGES